MTACRSQATRDDFRPPFDRRLRWRAPWATAKGRFGLLAAILLVPAHGAAESLRIVFEDGRPSAQIGLQRLESPSMESYLAANDLTRALDIERFWKPETGKLVFRIGERRVTVTVDARLVIVDDDDVLLHLPVRYRDSSVMLPLEILDLVFTPASGNRWRFDRGNSTLTVGRIAADVLGLDYGTVGGDTEVRLRLARSFQYRVQATSQALVRIRLFDAVLDPLALVADAPAPLLRSVRAEQRGREATLYLDLERNVDGFETSNRDGGRTLVVTLRRRTEPMPLPEFKLPESASEPPQAAAAGGCRVLILDPGHGGDDPGVESAGLTEKNVTLDLANRLVPHLEAGLRMRVQLLRNSDRSLGDDRRAELANRSGGDLLVSLHCNASFDATASGFEVLFAGANKAKGTAVAGAGDFRPWRAAQGPYAARSQRLAQMLQSELEKRLPVPNRGAHASHLAFLRGLAMPAVVVEVGFLTNATEADVLVGADYAERMAQGIAAAVQRYCDAAEGADASDQIENTETRTNPVAER